MNENPPRAHTPIGDGEYVTDVAYSRTFIPELCPALMRLVAALNGVASPPAEDFDYCELGSGTGDTLTTLAASYPHARFIGVDFNPEHVSFARTHAAKGAVENVEFLERDFEALTDDELPSFDFIALHGVVSWVSVHKRAALLALASAKLKPGGLLYVSYNTLPGWSAIEPLRRLMLDHTTHVAGTTMDRARAGRQLVERFANAASPYFASHPTAKSMLALMQKAGLPYVAHEYFHAHWHPMYFADLAREMASNDLHFVGQIPLFLNIRELALPPSVKDAVKASITDAPGTPEERARFESLKDFALNEFFRSDIYVRGKAQPSDATKREYLETTPFGTLTDASHIQREARLPHYTVKYTGPVYEALIAALAAGATNARALASQRSLSGVGERRIGDCLQNLSLGGQVVPMVAPSRGAVSPQSSTLPSTPSTPPTPLGLPRYAVPLAFNRMVLEQALSNQTPIVLASQTAGAGVTLSMLHAVCLRLLTEVAPADREAWLRAFVGNQALRIVVGDQKINGDAELIAAILRELDRFSVAWPAKLVELGILARA